MIQLPAQMKSKVKIVIDADVIIHFIKGESLHLLPQIFPNYQFVILDRLLNNELRNRPFTKNYLDNFFMFFPDAIAEIKWNPNYEMLKEFAELNKRYGMGESMSMVYCKFNNDVIASSNITEITDYCDANNIQYITTMDFIAQALKIGLMTEDECDLFLTIVIAKKSTLPYNKISKYNPRNLLL